ncbi:TonB-dependent siderophore receptor [Schlegelella sp. S2-27]|uniref:TonB-dependent siderophore receptor n=1 Tax=Caldimonas mangrovi TaxID=2944811 RepID=A0ABT0YTC2_9BURK|nr:TonB-dependent siderophore receptor [Caldimonas mangrovi]MCM5681093.1 TonB-dependent siderophore receptor [Caldimonas mangrovi]
MTHRHPHRPRPSSLALALQSALLVLSVTGTARAQQQPTPQPTGQTLPEIRVRAAPTDGVDGYAAKRSTAATKTDTPLVETPQSISVITREELDVRGAQNVQEALRYVAGVSAEQFGYDNRGFDYFMLRGFPAYGTSDFRDGLKQAGYYDLTFSTEPYGLERIEVLRGPASVLFGQGDAGGIVNRVSKRPTGNTAREVEVQLGSFGRKQLGVDVEGVLNPEGTLQYRLVGVGLDTETQIQYSTGERISNDRLYLAPSLRWLITPDTTLTVLSEFMKDRAGDDIWYRLDADGQLTDVLEGDPRYSWLERDIATIGYQFEHRFNDTLTLRQNFRRAHGRADKHHFWTGDMTEEGMLPRTAVLDEYELDQTVLDTQLQAKLRTGSVDHTVLVGLDWNHLKAADTTYLNNATPGLDMNDPVYGEPIAEPDTLDWEEKQKSTQLGFYVQDQIALGHHWRVTAGGRWDRARTTDTINGESTTQKDRAFSGRLALSYIMPSGWIPYVSYAESFLPQLGISSSDRPFDPTEGKQYEIGIKFQPQDTRYLFTAALFDLTKSNVPTPDQDDQQGRNAQTGEIRSRGLELEIKGQLARGLQATASYTYIDAEVTKSNVVDEEGRREEGKRPMQVPRHSASVWLNYRLASVQGLSLGAGVRHVGKRYNDNLNTSSQPSHTLVDAAVGYDTGPWRLSLAVTNLFDKDYVQSRAFDSYWQGVERTVRASVKYRW